MIPMILQKVEVRIPSFKQADKKDSSKIYEKVNVLPFGADSFLQLGCSAPVAVGLYDMQINYKKIEKGSNTYHFFDLIQAVPVAAK